MADLNAPSNAARLLAGENPVFTGPPCPGPDDATVHFLTNDPVLNRPNVDDDGDGDNGGKDPDTQEALPDDRDTDASLLVFHVARAYRPQ